MREIKFRSWVENDRIKDSIYPFMNYRIEFMGGAINDIFATSGQAPSNPLGNKITYMQYTGLKDKNGKEIYEGDIVKFCDFDSLRTGGNTSDKIQIAAVIESECSWIVNNDRYADFLYQAWANDSELEVIGNIYENPELLEVTK